MCLNHDYSDGGGNNSNENFMISQTSLAEVTASLQLSHDLLLFIGTYRQMGKWAQMGKMHRHIDPRAGGRVFI